MGERVRALADLPARTREVLLCVIGEYIATGQAVASRSALRLADLGVSAATIRATMNELMDAGLLAQVHASAGRTPTDAAFRLWVDFLLGTPGEVRRVGRGVEARLGEPEGDLDEYLRRAADLLSQATGQVGFFVGLEFERQRLQRVHFVRVSSERVMALLVSDGGVVRSRLIEEAESDQRALDRISTRVSEVVAGHSLEEARQRLADEIHTERLRSDALWRASLVLCAEGLLSDDEEELYIADRSPLLRQPEFSDVEELRHLVAALEEKERMLRLLNKIMRADGLQVVIGRELEDPGVQRCAVVTAGLGGPPPIGGLGVIGPVRMRYDRVIPLVRRVSERVGEALV